MMRLRTTLLGSFGLAAAAVALWAGAAAAAGARADTTGWRNTLVAGMNFSQSSFSNWTAGGTSSVAWAWALDGKFEQVEPRFNWRNKGKLEYGILKQQDEDLRKSVDLIDLETLYTRKLDFFVNPYGSAGLKTQFHSGRDYAMESASSNGEPAFPVTSDFADPIYLTQSLGVGRDLIPDELSARLGLSIRETITDAFRGYAIDDDESDLGLDFDACIGNPACDRSKVETGLESVTEFGRKLSETTAVSSKLGLFYSFEQPDELDVNWRSDLSIKALKVLSIHLGLELLFDEDVLDKLQTKQAMGIGVSYSLL